MRIGFFSDTYLPITFGTEISMETFKKELEKFGHEVFVFCPKYPDREGLEKNVFRFPSLRLMKSPENRLMFFGPAAVKKIVNLKLDVAHAHTPFSAGILAKLVAKKLKIPLFYTSHMLYPEYAKHWLIRENKILPILMKFYLKIYGNSCTALIAPSEKMKKLLEEYGVEKPIFVLPTGLDFTRLEKVQEKDSETKRKFNIPLDHKILLYVGRLTQEKNVGFLLEAFSEIRKKKQDVCLVLVGEGYLERELKERTKKLGLEKKVIFTGRILWEEVVKLYRDAYLFLFASLTDTQGLIIVEASYFGLPIVALKDESYQGMLIDGKNGFTVYPYDPVLFAKKVLEILNDEKLYQEFSKNGRELAKKFSAENQARKLVEIYEKMRSMPIGK
ncbi:MAG: glycosyltransferase [Patescibacteria group bacterium]|nr:glycosyltransferase [Patescibacteria group bacterium]